LDDCASVESEIVYSQPTHLGPGSSTTKNRIGSITAEDCASIVETTEEMRAKYQPGIRKFRAWGLVVVVVVQFIVRTQPYSSYTRHSNRATLRTPRPSRPAILERRPILVRL
jgi:hypothetical protein